MKVLKKDDKLVFEFKVKDVKINPNFIHQYEEDSDCFIENEFLIITKDDVAFDFHHGESEIDNNQTTETFKFLSSFIFYDIDGLWGPVRYGFDARVGDNDKEHLEKFLLEKSKTSELYSEVKKFFEEYLDKNYDWCIVAKLSETTFSFKLDLY